MVDSLDKDGDSKVTKKELIAAKILPADCASWLFDFADVDCSGSITATELHNALGRSDAPEDEEDWKKKKAAGKLPAVKKCSWKINVPHNSCKKW